MHRGNTLQVDKIEWYFQFISNNNLQFINVLILLRHPRSGFVEPKGIDAREIQSAIMNIAKMKPFREHARKNALTLVALAGLGITMPLLDLFSNYPQFFIAKDHHSYEVFVFGLILTLLPPLVVVGVEALAWFIHEKLGQIVHLILVAGLGLLLSLAVLRKLPLETDQVIWLIAISSAILLVLAERFWNAFQTGLRFLAITPLLAFLLFAAFSPSADLIWKGEAQIAPVPGIGNPVPVVILFFDEFPLASLLTEDGTINTERFPNFTRLANQSYWFRNSTSVFPWTTPSITTALTGNFPIEERAYDSIHYPNNLFTLLGDNYEMRVHEELTRLCPKALCDHPLESDRDTWTETTAGSRLLSSLIDTGVVYAHAVLPPDVRAHLPTINHAMGGFLKQDDVNAQINEGQKLGAKTALSQRDIFENLITSIRPTSQPTLYFMHIVFPHFPWELTPSGNTYVPEANMYDNLDAIPGLINGEDHWGEDVFLVRQGFQRHLMQVGYVDLLLGELIDKMQDARIWDRSLFVVVADHGVSFQPNQPRRGPTPKNLDEIYRVPFFLKVPHQEQGVINDDVVTLLDLMPTLVDALQIETDWTFQGRDLLGDSQPPLGRQVIDSKEQHVSASLDGLMTVADRNAEIFDRFYEGWSGLAAVGEYGSLVGESINELGPQWLSDFTWGIDQAASFEQVDFSSGYVPILITGELVVPPGMPAPGEVLIAVNDVIAGVAGGFICQGTECQFSALLAEELLHEGHNAITAFMSSEPSKPLSSKSFELP